jgi:hypothetical protein
VLRALQLVLSVEVPHAAGVPVQLAVLDQVQPLAVRQLAWAVMLAQVPAGVPAQLPVSECHVHP